MKVDVNEISALIREQIKEHENVIHNEDVGMVLSVGDGIALVYGLDDVMLNELVSFENGSYGLVLNSLVLLKEHASYLSPHLDMIPNHFPLLRH